ncbi:MAG: hypothetical protein KJ725_13775 [Gammaproteobacteria bacterium]|jgi:hypothetical protein|uniref:hypothetical protein n=1 Tax=unclassified Methylotuvimicrobium TaxID=2822412 RepID=UPI001E058D2A|nr:hypothetical protein [Gammaproteobacteria bacterium]
MLDFLKPKNVKIAESVARLFHPILHDIKSSNDGALPVSVLQDDYLIGYLAGSVAVAASFAGITNPKINGLTNLHFFERLFPKHGMTICRQHPEKMSSSEEYLSAYQEGVEGFNKIIGGLGGKGLKDITANDVDLGSLSEHIAHVYPLTS